MWCVEFLSKRNVVLLLVIHLVKRTSLHFLLQKLKWCQRGFVLGRGLGRLVRGLLDVSHEMFLEHIRGYVIVRIRIRRRQRHDFLHGNRLTR